MSTQKKTSVGTDDTTASNSRADIFNGSSRSAKRVRRKRLFSAHVNWIDRWLARKLMQVAGDPPISLALWDGIEVTPPIDHPVAKLQYWDRSALLKTIANDELYWGDLYSNGQVEVEGDLTEFVEALYQSTDKQGRGGWVRRFLWWLGNRRILNTHHKAKENIYHHYDIGNDFYKLWLDKEEMQYTCAYYPDADITLEQAQVAKLHHVCRKLQLKPGDTVVEAGCGWGGLARFMARNYGVNVKAYNISREQVEFARKAAEAEGLSDQVEYVLDDYRNITGTYDVFVSVGMLEHVGTAHYPELGEVINRVLNPEGRGLIHTIGRNKARPMNAWIERRIFPGAYPPSLREMMDIFEPGGLSVLDVENLRLHYARTLAEWLQRYEARIDEITDMMDESFVRAWRLYLAGSEAAFSTGHLQLFQVVFARTDNNQLPWSRAHLYSDKASVRPFRAGEQNEEI
jgi:cyclopropane-fatty-acyl-phospholipid synthase